MKAVVQLESQPKTRKELRKLYQRVVKKISAMSSKERFRTMVRAGIYTEKGDLTKHYR